MAFCIQQTGHDQYHGILSPSAVRQIAVQIFQRGQVRKSLPHRDETRPSPAGSATSSYAGHCLLGRRTFRENLALQSSG
jgi:hypothetical protein